VDRSNNGGWINVVAKCTSLLLERESVNIIVHWNKELELTRTDPVLTVKKKGPWPLNDNRPIIVESHVSKKNKLHRVLRRISAGSELFSQEGLMAALKTPYEALKHKPGAMLHL